MALPSQTEEFDDIVTSTLQFFVPGEADQTIKDNPVLNLFMSNKKEEGMGKQIEFIVTYGDNNSVDWAESSTQTYKFTPSSVMTKGKIRPALLTGHVLWSLEEKEQNSGDEQIADLAESKMEQLRSTFDRKLSVAFYSNGTVNGKRCISGLRSWVATSTGTVANINDSTFPWWQPKFKTGAGLWSQYGWFGSLGNIPLWMFINVSDGGRKPDVILSDHGTFQVFLNALGTGVRYIDEKMFTNPGGALDLSFMGARYVYDKYCPAGTMYFLHTRDWRFYVSPGMNFTVLPVDRIYDAPMMSYSFMVLRCQLVCVRRNLQGVVTGWTIPSF